MKKAGTPASNFYYGLSKVLMYYFPGVATYWDTITPCQIKGNLSSPGKYYLDFSSKYFYPGNFTKEGVPLFKLNEDIEILNPTVICQYALGIFDLNNDKEFTETGRYKKFLIQADWLVANGQPLRHGLGWYLNYDIPEYDLKSPWISALTQGEAISVLCRAYLLKKEQKYLDCAEQALIPYGYNISEGGLRNYFNNIPIYEEYPSEKVNIVLNGFIFALFGFYDLYLTNSNKSAKKLFDTGLESLEKIIHYFDVKYWSQYNLYYFPKDYLASYKYHILHIEQLKALYFLTKKDFLKDAYKKWQSYNSRFCYRSRALFNKLVKNNFI